MNKSLIEVIQRSRELELKAEKQRKESNFVKKEISNIKSETSLLSGNKLQEVNNVGDTDFTSLCASKVESLYMVENGKHLSMNKLPEMKEQVEKEKTVLEELHSKIWQDRKDFCDQVRIFNDQHGLLAPTRQRIIPFSCPVVKQESEKNADMELNCLEREVGELETKFQQFIGPPSDWKNEQVETKKELDRLCSQTSADPEFTNTEESIQYHQKLTEKLEFQYASLQVELNSHEKPAENIGDSECLPTRMSETQLINSEFSSRPKVASIHTPRLNSALLQVKQMGQVKLPQSTKKSVNLTKLSDVAKSSDALRPSVMNVTAPTRFQPKTPSEVTLRLMASKKNFATLERQMHSYFNCKIPGDAVGNKPPQVAVEELNSAKSSAMPTLKYGPLSSTTNISNALPPAISIQPNSLPFDLNSYQHPLQDDPNKVQSKLNLADTQLTANHGDEQSTSDDRNMAVQRPLKSILKRPLRQPFIS